MSMVGYVIMHYFVYLLKKKKKLGVVYSEPMNWAVAVSFEKELCNFLLF